MGWRKAGELGVGSAIATPRKLLVENEKEYDRDKLRVLAYILADGSLSGCGATADFVSKSPELIHAYTDSLNAFERVEARTLQQVRDITRVMVAGTEKTHCYETNSLVLQLREWGLNTMKGGCRSDEKFVPEFIFGLSEDAIAFSWHHFGIVMATYPMIYVTSKPSRRSWPMMSRPYFYG